jgi:hypothetical protein
LPGVAVGRARRQRRPTGEPPPLPRRVTITTTSWLVLAAIVLAAAFVAALHAPWLRVDDRASTWLLRPLAGIRAPWLTDIANAVNVAGSGWGASVVGLSVVALAVAFRRWRHLLVFVAGLVVLNYAGTWIYFGLSRPRPYGVPIIGGWVGYAGASPPVAVLTFCLMGVVYCLAVPGRARSATKAAMAAVVAVFGLARLYLGVDHPGDVLLGAAFAVAIAVTAFRYFTPNEVFPVAYRRGRAAHVDVTGRRAEAIRQAMRDQLGLEVTEIKPVGLESSAGSTPLRLRVQGGPDEFVFAKLYTKGHVRADRWYKLARTILYGTLEDESPFQTVRRLAEYEDYALHLLREAGVRTARPYGIVEITPEREYLLVTEFFTGAVEIDQADVDDKLIDQGLALIRKLWDTGVAHRDIKPGNLMVRSGHPERITAIISQNGNAYEEGLSDGWNPVQAYWREPSKANREAIRVLVEPQTTIWQYTHGVPDKTRISPDGYGLDNYYLARSGADEIQLDLFLDYASNVALYPTFQEYFRTSRPPLLAVWGRNEPFFLPSGAEAFKRDIPDADVRFVDTGHFALETHAEEIATAIAEFLTRQVSQHAASRSHLPAAGNRSGFRGGS